MGQDTARFTYRKPKVCSVCGQTKPMFRIQKTCDECRHRLGKDITRVPKGCGRDAV